MKQSNPIHHLRVKSLQTPFTNCSRNWGVSRRRASASALLLGRSAASHRLVCIGCVGVGGLVGFSTFFAGRRRKQILLLIISSFFHLTGCVNKT